MPALSKQRQAGEIEKIKKLLLEEFGGGQEIGPMFEVMAERVARSIVELIHGENCESES